MLDDDDDLNTCNAFTMKGILHDDSNINILNDKEYDNGHFIVNSGYYYLTNRIKNEYL